MGHGQLTDAWFAGVAAQSSPRTAAAKLTESVTILMEKSRAHYPLETVLKKVEEVGVAAFTRTALENARHMGLDGADAVLVVIGLTRTDFYKSMTTHGDHSVWQDVYHRQLDDERWVYIKLTLREGAVVIQFKER